MRQWLARTTRQEIFGPWGEEDLKVKIKQGELALEDEICVESGYWFSLHESDEMKKHLGMVAPARRKRRTADDEETQTETAIGDDENTDSIPVPFQGSGIRSLPRESAPHPQVVVQGTGPSGPEVPQSPPLLALFLTLVSLGFVVFLAYLLKGAR